MVEISATLKTKSAGVVAFIILPFNKQTVGSCRTTETDANSHKKWIQV